MLVKSLFLFVLVNICHCSNLFQTILKTIEDDANRLDVNYIIFNSLSYFLNDLKCNDMLDQVLKIQTPSKFIVTDVTFDDIDDTEHVFVVTFIPDVKYFFSTFELLQNSSFFHPRSYFYFLFCSELKQNIDENVLENIWKAHILNFVVCFILGEEVHLVTYSPFNLENKVVSLKVSQNRYFDKLKDLNGHILRARVFNDTPRNYFSQGQWIGSDIDTTRLLMKMLNASAELHLIKDYGNSATAMKKGDVDLCAIARLLDDSDIDSGETEFTYPSRISRLAVLLPKSERTPLYKLIRRFFSLKKIFLIFFSLISISWLDNFLKYPRNAYSYYRAFEYLGVIFVIPMVIIKRKSFILMSWFLCSVVIGSSINSALLSKVINVEYENKITTISQLVEHDIQLYTGSGISNRLPKVPGLQEKIISSSLQTMRGMILGNNATKIGFILSHNTLVHCLDALKEMHKPVTHEIMEETFNVIMYAYMLKRRSPFLDKFNLYLHRIRQSGLPKIKSYKTTPEVEHNKLNFEYFLACFHVLIVGYTVSFLVFVIENIVFNLKRRKNKI